MAESLLDSYLTCSICLDTFTEPVTLGCNHSFCSSCIQEIKNGHWRLQPLRPCPVCRRRSSKEHPITNFALRALSEEFRQKLKLSASAQSEGGAEGKAWSVCPSHPQVPPLFCQDDRRPLCPVCEFSEHPQHTVVRGEEAERRLEELISSQLQALKEDRRHCEQLQRHSEEQAGQCERHIRAVFSGLHRFLEEEEQRALSALTEEQNMGPELEKLRETLSSVDKSIKELERQLQTHTYTQHQRPPAPGPTAGRLLDQARVLGNLGFRVWRNMRRAVQHRPVLLDPNTAHRRLLLSEDLSSVKHGDSENEDLPLNKDRFTHCSSVLGSEGFSSGVHQWDVEVGDHPLWGIGVVKESVERKKSCSLKPNSGFWCLFHFSGTYSDVFRKALTLQRRPQKVRVQLDYDRGQLTFSDADHMTPICSYTGSFTEKMFPYFGVGPEGGAETTELRICADVWDSDGAAPSGSSLSPLSFSGLKAPSGRFGSLISERE